MLVSLTNDYLNYLPIRIFSCFKTKYRKNRRGENKEFTERCKETKHKIDNEPLDFELLPFIQMRVYTWFITFYLLALAFVLNIVLKIETTNV